VEREAVVPLAAEPMGAHLHAHLAQHVDDGGAAGWLVVGEVGEVGRGAAL